jgi:hypothetical protein
VCVSVCVCVCLCVASHYATVQNNSSFMFKYSIFSMPKTNRLLTVSVQVSALDNILMYSYVHNVCIFHYHIEGMSISVSYVSYLGGPGFNFSLNHWRFPLFSSASLCKCQDIISNYVMNINFHTSPGNLLSSHQSTLCNVRHWKHYYRNDE